MNKQKHKLYMAQILTMVFKDKDLCNLLGFKGGTALMFFHGLPRFSTDLDFNLLDESKVDFVYEKVRNILSKFGKIDDEAKKFFRYRHFHWYRTPVSVYKIGYRASEGLAMRIF